MEKASTVYTNNDYEKISINYITQMEYILISELLKATMVTPVESLYLGL